MAPRCTSVDLVVQDQLAIGARAPPVKKHKNSIELELAWPSSLNVAITYYRVTLAALAKREVKGNLKSRNRTDGQWARIINCHIDPSRILERHSARLEFVPTILVLTFELHFPVA